MPGPSLVSRNTSGTASRRPSMMPAGRRIQKPACRRTSAGRTLEAVWERPAALEGLGAATAGGALVLWDLGELPPSASPHRGQEDRSEGTLPLHLLQMRS